MASLILAAVPGAGPYVDLIKIAVVVVLLLGWSAAVQWVDRDTDVVKTKRAQWNVIVMSGGVVAVFVLLVPGFWAGSMFAVGVAFWMLLSGAPMVGYLMHRNGRVAPPARVLTIGHIKRLLGAGRGKRRPKDKGLRVHISDHADNFVELPDDYEDALDFQAVQDFMFELLWRRASDADVLAGKEKYRLVYRIDGVANEHPDGIPPEDGERILRYLKKLAGLNVEEIRRLQTGRIKVALLTQEKEPGFTEVHTSGTTAGERLRLRIEAEPKLFRLHELGMARPRFDILRKQILAKHSGLVLFSAPPQHGLTTTQYAVLRSHDAYMNHIHALERRPLTELDNVTQQRYEGANKDVNYARMLQTMIRREPDIVMVGECEDRETALVASRAAAEKQKIYMGFQAGDCFDALTRFTTLLNDNRLAAKVLRGIVNQRLVRLLCSECREAFEPDPATLKKLNLPAEKIERFYRPPSEPKLTRRGKPILCQKCQGTGYLGRTAIFELLVADAAVKKLIAEGVPIKRIKDQCRKNKMYYLQEEGLLNVISGATSMNELLRCLRTNEK